MGRLKDLFNRRSVDDRLVRDDEAAFYITESGIEDNGQLVRQVERARGALKAGK